MLSSVIATSFLTSPVVFADNNNKSPAKKTVAIEQKSLTGVEITNFFYRITENKRDLEEMQENASSCTSDSDKQKYLNSNGVYG